MARVAGVNIPDKKQAWISLTHIFGIGRTRALKICSETGIAHDTKIGSLDEADLEKLRKAVAEFEVEGDLRRDISTNCLLYTSPSPRDGLLSRMPSSA